MPTSVYPFKGSLRLLFGIDNIKHEVISYDKNHMVTCLISPLKVYHSSSIFGVKYEMLRAENNKRGFRLGGVYRGVRCDE